jgi:ATP/maltotriose-dependent transcriptional regulator MalT
MELVERDGAARLLDGLLEDAAAGSGRLVLVSGEAGVGKTAPVTGFLGRCGARVPVPRGAQRATRDHPHQLTGRQREILALLSEGLSDAEIAGR